MKGIRESVDTCSVPKPNGYIFRLGEFIDKVIHLTVRRIAAVWYVTLTDFAERVLTDDLLAAPSPS